METVVETVDAAAEDAVVVVVVVVVVVYIIRKCNYIDLQMILLHYETYTISILCYYTVPYCHAFRRALLLDSHAKLGGPSARVSVNMTISPYPVNNVFVTR